MTLAEIRKSVIHYSDTLFHYLLNFCYNQYVYHVMTPEYFYYVQAYVFCVCVYACVGGCCAKNDLRLLQVVVVHTWVSNLSFVLVVVHCPAQQCLCSAAHLPVGFALLASCSYLVGCLLLQKYMVVWKQPLKCA